MYHNDDTFNYAQYFGPAAAMGNGTTTPMLDSTPQLAQTPFPSCQSHSTLTLIDTTSHDTVEQLNEQWTGNFHCDPQQSDLVEIPYEDSPSMWAAIEHSDTGLEWSLPNFEYLELGSQEEENVTFSYAVKEESLSFGTIDNLSVPIAMPLPVPVPMQMPVGHHYEEPDQTEPSGYEQPIKKQRTGYHSEVVTATESMLVRVGFLQLPEVLFDTATIPIWQLLNGCVAKEDSPLDNTIVIYPVYYDKSNEKITGPRQMFRRADDEFKFPSKFNELLSDINKRVVLHLEEVSSKGGLMQQLRSKEITIIHDGLKDKPSVITPDVFFFPQLVVINHLKSCNSKATLSKRHKNKKVKEGTTWCHNPDSCRTKKKCSCQAYPSRHIKKGLRLLLALLKKHNAPDTILTNCKRLYKMVSTAANKQVQALPDYNSFLSARADRWGVFMMLKRYAEQKDTPMEVSSQFDCIWSASQATGENIIFQ